MVELHLGSKKIFP
ncbi:hypothetical protein FWK35_00004787 [Aphis craccivora]|uniref:Uncharacterized protein n=1 Tax=Aphis craccivora TaxID=307492 RepID=A0A6G0Z4Y4_APHCR|nr:hypothetical protein FWK35_00004787 [Aphis craccivora]